MRKSWKTLSEEDIGMAKAELRKVSWPGEGAVKSR